jgi:hypothetical protein
MADDDPLGTIAEIKSLPKADRELVVGGNAVRLLKIKRPKVAAKPEATPKATAKVAAKAAPAVKPKRKA